MTIHELVVHDVLPVAEEVLRQPSRKALDHALDVRISVRCSSGTYIRAIARDLGAGLGVGGHLTVLRRTAVGTFDLAIARTLDQLGRHFDLVPLTHAARASFPGLDLDPGQASDVRFGRALHLDLRSPGPVALFDPDGEFLALYEQRAERAVATAVFV